MRVFLRVDRCRVIWHDKNAILTLLLQGLMDWANDVAIDGFQRFDFFIDSPFMAGFVRRLDMNADNVMRL